MKARRSVLLLLVGLILASCAESDAPDDETNPIRPPRISRILSAEEALAGAYIPGLDPATMNDAEIEKVLGSVPLCEFQYTISGKPALALTNSPSAGSVGVLKLNGSLIRLRPANSETGGSQNSMTMIAGPVRVSLSPIAPSQLDGMVRERQEMNLLFEIDDRLRVGYRGYYSCLPSAEGTNKQVRSGSRP